MDSAAAKSTTTTSAKGLKTIKHNSCFDRPAAEFPYMFIGALEDAPPGAVELALGKAVADVGNVSASEALVGWALPAEPYYSLSEPRSAADVSRAAFKYHKGSLRIFRSSMDEESWQMWEAMGKIADSSGIATLIDVARAAATMRDTRRLALQDALYFAGLATDGPGKNVNAWAMRDNKCRDPRWVAFVKAGPVEVPAIRDAARTVAAEIVADHAASSGKRKRAATSAAPSAEDEESARKLRRAALMSAIIDVGIGLPSEMSEVERAFVESGPLKTADVMKEAEMIARRRCPVA